MAAKSVLLSAGHSNTDPGAVANGRREADIAVEFRNLVAFYLDRAGLSYATDGKGTDNLPLPQAARLARLHNVAVEFHCNAGPSSATGVECLSDVSDAALSARICRAISEGLGIRDRGAKPENAGQHHRLAFVQAGGIIVELFFLTNRDDLRAYYDRKWVAARNVAEVLERELGA